jgi:hypothetical protein
MSDRILAELTPEQTLPLDGDEATDLIERGVSAREYPHQPCSSGGPAPADQALAAQLAGKIHGSLHGRVTAERICCARQVVEAVKARRLSERAAVIAVTTTIVESTILNINVELDHDSLGLFQQRASWGSRENRLNPTWATNAFLNAMLRKFPDGSWQTEPIGEVCQTVQVSAYPDRYQYQAGDAATIVAALWRKGKGRTDVNGDGHGDLVVHSRGPGGTGELWVWTGYDKGLYQTPKKVFDKSRYMADAKIAVADVTGNGCADVIFARARDARSVELYLAPGRTNGSFVGNWGEPITTFGRPLESLQLCAGDLNGNGHADLVVYCQGPEGLGELWVWAGYAKGLYQTPTKVFEKSKHMANAKIAVADVTGEGRADVIFARARDAGSVEFYLAPGNAGDNFVDAWGKPITTFGRPLENLQLGAGDLNGNGHADLVIYCRAPDGSGELWAWTGYAKGLYQTPKKVFEKSKYMADAKIAVVDVTGEGRADVIFLRGIDDDSVELYVAPGNAGESLVGNWGKPITIFGRPLDALQVG